MLAYKISPSSISGNVCIPPSKSHTLRAIFWASVSHGTSIIDNALESPDSAVMIQACKQLGAKIHKRSSSLEITGTSNLRLPENTVINAGSSGIVFRFFTAIAAIFSEKITITGSSQLQRRPIAPLIKALENFGATFSYQGDLYTIPFSVSGPISSGYTEVLGDDSQYASALAMACSLAEGPFSFTIINPKERPWFKLTLWWLEQLAIPYAQSEDTYSFLGKARPKAFSYTVGGDFSSAAFLVAAALLSQSPHPTYLKNLNIDDVQGDKKLFFLLQKLGANIIFENNTVIVFPSTLSGGDIDMDPFIDALPILAVICCFATSPSHLYNARGAKDKESDRIIAITQELQKMGACIQPCHDGLLINPSPLYGASMQSHNDHRIAMALSIAAMYASGDSIISDTECIKKTFPNFIQILNSLHTNIQEYYEPIFLRTTNSGQDLAGSSLC
ncbi:3-phosphoshikimate 1-carboxyvinyltransferase,3-phosphoshikimate 1-carboxyvinyltransferase,5-enolpyruvylshikimate-3-phosphate synthase,3-phosphoshikimate 1-carboxyvinyltransferase,EPSP synthase (3-phosphoshikimate 1-carboxyvinyltransferase) [Chlamydia poikilotherma]|uniref:3-phosphoshikimate 1-carboxyvinyltransferase n=1 Tax=Chlamydia poikilotherma TaxID=1967783 RepID=A0A3B0Q8I5_9CHLA|nr:3-phosphoshikimate 1-carboxyvinyltransferase [Chlamydia poikilotherma]SYX09187.1 3-phosphoshikimate 1-carboxyvinyltransferase,3-phosphoshikimate 1-carboxyvinyltransferase,5-enolpyruvylshikimate-3-phosphate synthase,3-phosphoshikimate 1-carboxyvinyltransferase,EPSP synthase (3-phosphoshikimate 1-carboxyvinyltransferase) [Chlamydia poikilotherma]